MDKVVYKQNEKSEVSYFGYLLRYYRKQKGLSLKELEKKTGVTASYINRLERGYKKSPSLSLVKELAEALEVPVYMLLGGEDKIEVEDISHIICKLTSYQGKKLNLKQKETLIKIINLILDKENYKSNYLPKNELMKLVDKFYNEYSKVD